MWIVVGIVTFIFLCNAFFSTAARPAGEHTFVSYLFTQAAFMETYIFIFFLGFLIITGIFFRLNFDRKLSFHTLFVHSSIQTLFVFIIGTAFSYAILGVIAFLHLAIFSFFINTNPEALGVVRDTKIIAERLKKENDPATVMITDGTKQQVLVTLAKATSGTNNFYGEYMLSGIPSFLIPPSQDEHYAVLLIDNTVIVGNLEGEKLEAMSPFLGYLLVKQHFPRRVIKAYPKVTFMDRDEYALFRAEDALKKVERIDVELEKIDSMIASLSAQIETESRDRRQRQKLLEEYQYYQAYYESEKEQLANSATHVPNELGVFKQPDSITMVFNPEKKQGIIDYLAMFVHEYLHYASYVDDEKRFASAFFEEALTEYFTRNIIKQSFATKTNLGYPLQVKVLTEINKMYTDSELAEIYFTKDEDLLIHAINRVYGENFYEENYAVFETLQYTSDPEQAVELANMIMAKIGGNKLTEKDLISTYSKN